MLICGCEPLSYYTQAIRGQAEMWRASRPVTEVVGDSQSSEALRERLKRAIEIREFASRELGLPDNDSYRRYADLKRQYVVWNVFAAEQFSVAPIQWCFPVAGCVAYKGFFGRADADRFADELRREGKEVFVSGVPAYSTLGFFDDPLLNTFIHYPSADLARLIFHELAHQVAYVRDDSIFNESFAVAVEREGVRRWIERHGGPQDLENFRRTQARREQFFALAGEFRSRLERLYASGKEPGPMAAEKRAVFAELAREYDTLKSSWGGFKGYDAWLGPSANNAVLASIAVYTHDVPAFVAMLEQLDGDLPRFYADVKALAGRPKAERDAVLGQLRERTKTPGIGGVAGQ
jgi:predicted aminopeptidase